jgi:hypothetical protein
MSETSAQRRSCSGFPASPLVERSPEEDARVPPAWVCVGGALIALHAIVFGDADLTAPRRGSEHLTARESGSEDGPEQNEEEPGSAEEEQDEPRQRIGEMSPSACDHETDWPKHELGGR